MAKQVTQFNLAQAALISIVAAAIAYAVPLFFSGQRNISAIENIHGIPYPVSSAAADASPARIITESLAHADIHLKEPVAFKNLKLNIQFDPGNTKTLSVGIRQDPFWLSYGDRVTIYRQQAGKPGVQSAQATIPLTDKLQAPDRSVDLMFFAEGEPVQWQLHSISTTVQPASVSPAHLKDYIRSILKRERPQ